MPPSYRDYDYPLWAQVLGWIIASLSLLCIPVYAIIEVIRSPGDNWREVIINYFKVLSHNEYTIV